MRKQPQSEMIISHYASGYEAERLSTGSSRLERERTEELLLRFLPPSPARILDVGGGTGVYACWLAKRGYEVHLTDITPLHVELAMAASSRQPEAPLASAVVGDARSLLWNEKSVDVILLLGPLYHLTEEEDRLHALREAYRVLKPGGVLIAVGISRFASTLDGLRSGFLEDPQFAQIVDRDLESGQHRNPTGRPEYFTDTFFHHPDELRREVATAGFAVTGLFGVEGPGWLAANFDEWWDKPDLRDRLLKIARKVESEPSLLAISAHLVVAGTR